MAAKKSGGTAGRVRAKNQATAAALKAAGIERWVGNCPVCHKTVSLAAIYWHIGKC